VPKLPDVLSPGLALVVCGSAAGARSAAVGAYYAGPGNAFWRTLAETGLTPRLLAPAEFPSLPHFGIGLTDLVKDQSGADSALDFARVDRDRFAAKIARYGPATLCFNGKRSAQEFFGVKAIAYGWRDETIGATRLFVAPSTSGAARGAWDPRYWRTLAEWVLAQRASLRDV